MAGFKNDTKYKITKKLMDRLKTKQPELTVLGNNAINEAVFSYAKPVFDTGNLERNSKTVVFVKSFSILIKFITDNVPYSKYPYFGLGTSRKYGPRPYLAKAAEIVAKQLKLKK